MLRNLTRRSSIPLALAVALAISTPLQSQNATSGGLNGVVTDPSLAVVPAVAIELRDSAKGTSQRKITNSEGEYSFPFLSPGSYTLKATGTAFRPVSQTFDINVGPPVTLNIKLAIKMAHETVSVTDAVPLLHAENGDTSSTINELQVAEVPNPGNDLTYTAQTAPGAIMNTDGGGGTSSILGMPGTSNLFTLNGMSYTDIGGNVTQSSATNLLLGLNQVQEATIVTNGYSGQLGVLAGAAVSYVTKSGSNDFHGNALYFWNGSVLNANSWINNAISVPRPFDNANQWAASIGGPLRKDKLFFFFDTEGLRLLVPQGTQEVMLPSPQFEAATVANIDSKFGAASASNAFYKQIFALYQTAPGAGKATPGTLSDALGCTGFVGPNGLGTTTPCAVHYETDLGRATYESMVAGRMDWNIKPEDRVFLLVEYSRGHQASFTDAISPLFNFNSNQPWWQGQLVETHSIGASIVNQFLLAGSRLSVFGGPPSFSDTLAALPVALNWNGTGIFTNLGSRNGSAFGGVGSQYQASDDIVANWRTHKLGFGASLLRHDEYRLFGIDQGTLTPFTLDAFYQGGFDPATPFTDATQLMQSFRSQGSRRILYSIFGFYAQDEWHARPNLSLTLALRAEHPTNPLCPGRCFARLTAPFASIDRDPEQPYNQAIVTDLKHAFDGFNGILYAPRFSFAWQPFGVSHNSVVRGGFGIFYDALPSITANLIASNPPLSNRFAIQDNNLTPNEGKSLFKDAANSNAELVNGFSEGESYSELQARVNGFSPPALVSPDKVLKTPRYQKWSLELQQAVDAATSISVGYFGNHGLHELIQNQSANAFGFASLPPAECTSPPVLPCGDSRFGEVNQLTTTAVSNYNGVVLSFQHRTTGLSQGVFQANYTYGHAFDVVSNGGLLQFALGSSEVPQDPNHPRGSYGQADYDVRHSLNANYVWEVPIKAALRGRGSNFLVQGWQVSGTVFARTGVPYTVIDYGLSVNLQANNFYGPVYAVLARSPGPAISCGKGAAIPLARHPCQPSQVLADGLTPDPDALFVQSGCETAFGSGNLPGPNGPCDGAAVSLAQQRNSFRYPSYFSTDFSILKNTKVSQFENIELGIGVRFFNVLNHPNFGGPVNSSSDQAFGQIFYMESPPTGIQGAGLGADASPRNIQLKVQLKF